MNEPTIDLSDARNIPATLRGKPVTLMPLEDGMIAMGDAQGRPFWVGELSEVRDDLTFAADLTDDPADGEDADEMYAAWQRFRNGDDAPETAGNPEDEASLSGDPDAGTDDGGFSRLTDDAIYDAWRRQYAAERGAALAETPPDALKPGDAVEWGSGFGVGHGIVMEVDAASGNVNVHACDVVSGRGAGEQLSPTGERIKIDGSKLRRSSLKTIGTEPIGPELAGDLSDDPDVGTEDDDDASFWNKLQRQMRQMRRWFRCLTPRSASSGSSASFVRWRRTWPKRTGNGRGPSRRRRRPRSTATRTPHASLTPRASESTP